MKRIKEYYNELLSYKQAAPKNKGSADRIWDRSIRDGLNQLVDLIVAETKDEDYKRFYLTKIDWDKDGGTHDSYVGGQEYRSKVSAIASKIEAQYPDVKELPQSQQSPVFNISQNQSVEVILKLTLDFQTKVEAKLHDPAIKLSTEERTFLQKVKDSLSKVNSYSTLIITILTHAAEVGIKIEDIIKLLT